MLGTYSQAKVINETETMVLLDGGIGYGQVMGHEVCTNTTYSLYLGQAGNLRRLLALKTLLQWMPRSAPTV